MNVCLLLDGESLPEWPATALSYLLERSDVTVTSILYNEYEPETTTWETVQRAVELREWAVVAALNDALFGGDARGRRVPIGSIVDRSTVEEYSVMPTIVDGWKQRIPEEAVEAIGEETDVAIRFGFGFLVGPILSELPYGVLSYHHGDLREYRGQPMGFWEFVHGQETAGITVQQLTETLDGGGIAASKTVRIDDLRTWEAVKRRLFDESADMLLTAVEALQNDAVEEPETLGDLYTHPKGWPVATFALKNTSGHLLGRAASL